MDLRLVPEKEKELLRKRDREGWISYKASLECPGGTFLGAVVVAILLCLGWVTWLLTWIPGVIILCLSIDKNQKKYIKQHRKELEIKYAQRLAAWDIEMERQNKRQQLKKQGIPTCPSCMSEKVEVFTQISNSFSGRYEYGKPKMVCKVCGRTFNPGE